MTNVSLLRPSDQGGSVAVESERPIADAKAIGDRAHLPRPRLNGIDYLRVVCAVAVVARHAGLGDGVHASPDAEAFRSFFSFAVPAFLALSFFLQLEKRWTGVPWLLQRFQRIAIPYTLWSAIHLAARTAKYAVRQDPGKIQALLADRVGLVFLGGASLQLYFLPVVYVGNVVGACLLRSLLAIPPIMLGAVVAVVMFIGGVTGGVAAGSHPFAALIALEVPWAPALGGPFPQVTRVLAAYLACALCCLPLIAWSAALLRWERAGFFERGWFRRSWLLVFGVFVMMPMAFSWHWMAVGVSAVGAAIALSRHLPPVHLVRSIARYSFGVFVIHDLILQGMLLLSDGRWQRAAITFPELIFMTIAGFGLSLLVVWLGARLGRFGRTFFAVG